MDLECWRGHWYLAGWDRERRPSGSSGSPGSPARSVPAQAAFTAPVPDHVTVRETVESWAGETATGTARIRLRAGHGYPLRARALTVRDLGDGWDELEIPTGTDSTPGWWSSGPDVVVLEPAELRADVVDRLRAVAKG